MKCAQAARLTCAPAPSHKSCIVSQWRWRSTGSIRHLQATPSLRAVYRRWCQKFRHFAPLVRAHSLVKQFRLSGLLTLANPICKIRSFCLRHRERYSLLPVLPSPPASPAQSHRVGNPIDCDGPTGCGVSVVVGAVSGAIAGTGGPLTVALGSWRPLCCYRRWRDNWFAHNVLDGGIGGDFNPTRHKLSEGLA